MKRKILSVIILLPVLFYSSRKEQPTTDLVAFEEHITDRSGYFNGSDTSGSFTSGNINFVNHYIPGFRESKI
jgi:hypothetical protein